MLCHGAVSTGFRHLELASLTVDSFDLNAQTPTVTIQAAYSKRRRTDTRPLRSDIASMFRVLPRLAKTKRTSSHNAEEAMSGQEHGRRKHL